MLPHAERGRFAGTRALCVLIPLLGLVGVSVRAQLVTIDPGFPAGVGPDAFLTTLARQSDGRLLIAGPFTNLNGAAQPRLARLTANGALDGSFAPQLNSDPRRIVPLGDGDILVVGPFTNVGGVFRAGLARLNFDGSLDAAFDPPALSLTSAPYGGGFVTTNGSVLVTGTFTNLGGLPRNRLARLLPDGSVDPGFQSPFLPTNTVSIVALQPDDKVIVAGNFRDVAGTPRDGLVRLNPDGSVDPVFQPATGSTNRVSRALLQPDGRLIVVVNGVTGTGFQSGPQRLLRLNGDGSLDTAFDVQFSFPGFPFNSVLTGLALQGDGRIVVSGRFLRVNGIARASVARLRPDGRLDECFELGLAAEATVLAVETEPDGGVLVGGGFAMIQGELSPNLARLIPPGTCDPGLIEFPVAVIQAREDEPGVVVPVVRRGGEDREQTVAFATRDHSGVAGQDYDAVTGTISFARGERSQAIVVPLRRDTVAEGAETFEIVLSEPGGGAGLGVRTNAIVTVNDALPGTAGAPDTNFVVELDAPVVTVLPMSDGRVMIGGSFTNVNGQLNPGLARLLTDGSRDPGFVRSQPLDGDPLALALEGNGRLVVGGRFRIVDGTWRPGAARFETNGSLDASFAPFSAWPTNQAGYSVEIEHLTVLADGSIVVGGSVPDGDYGTQGALFKLSSSGEIDLGFSNRIPTGVQVQALASASTGAFLVGGTGLGASLVRLRPDGTVDLSFTPPSDRQVGYFSSPPRILPDERVVVAGVPSAFVGLPGQPLMWRLNPDGSADPAFAVFAGSPNLGQIYNVERFSAAEDGRVLIAGAVSGSTGSAVELRRLRADGSRDPSFDQGTGLAGPMADAGATLNALVELPAGGWLLGGDFGGYDGFNQGHLVKVLPELLTRPLEFAFTVTNLTIAETNGAVTLEVVRRGDASGSASVTVRTGDGTATAGQDYILLDTSIDFAPGEWSRTVAVTVLNDSAIENAEQFVVGLTNATAGFIVREPSTVTVQVGSDDAGVEFVADSFPGREEDGYVLAGVRWTGGTTLGLRATVNIFPEVGTTNDLVSTSLLVPESETARVGGTNWFRIAVVEDGLHQATRQFRLELIPSDRVVPGPRSNATLVIEDLDYATAPSRGVAGVVEAIANSPSGGVYVAGDFTGVHGVPRNRVARLLPGGDADVTFDPGAGPDANVTALAVQSDGRLLIAGDFTTVSGVPRARVARLNPDGSLDGTFDPGAGPASTIGTPFIRALVSQSDGGVLIGGAYSHFDGQLRGLVARVHPDGSLDNGFTSPFGAPSSGTKFDPAGRGEIQDVVITSEGKILAAGNLTAPGPPGSVPTSYGSVVRLTSTGQRDSGLRAIPVNSLDHIAWSIATRSDGKVLVGGTGLFGSGQIGTQTVETNWVAIRRFTTNGVLDPGFRVTNTPSISFYSSEIRQIAIQPDGRILFVAGILIRTAKTTEELDRAIVGRLLPDGAWDNGFSLVTCAVPMVRETGPFWFNTPLAPAFRFPPPPVPAAFLAVQSDGVIVLAGAFDSVNGEPRRRMARLDPDGALRGVIQLGISAPDPVQLYVPPEVELPYVIESSPDLRFWSPWRTNTSPWRGWSEPVDMGELGDFFRARGID